MADTVNNELNKYWALLDTQERASVLSVIKSFLRLKSKTAGNDAEHVYKDEFVAELDSRYEDYLAGGKTYTIEESLRQIEKVLSK